MRPISFARALPKLFSKFATLGAVGGGATIAGLVYVQNQATAAGNYVAELFNKTKGGAELVAGGVYEGATDTVTRLRRGWYVTRDKIEAPPWLKDIFEGKDVEEGGSGEVLVDLEGQEESRQRRAVLVQQRQAVQQPWHSDMPLNPTMTTRTEKESQETTR